MRRFSQRKKKLNLPRVNKKNTKKIILICVVLFLISFTLLVLRFGIFNIKNVEVNLDKKLNCVNIDQINEYIKLSGQQIFLVNDSEIINSIKEKYICVREVLVFKSYPDKIKIEVFAREEVAKVVTFKTLEATSSSFLEDIATASADISQEFLSKESNKTNGLLTDKEGVIFSQSTRELDIPTIFYENVNLVISNKPNLSVKNSLQILEKIKNLGFDIKSSLILPDLFVIFKSDTNPKVIFKLNDAIDPQIASLQLIMDKAKINRRTISTDVERNLRIVPTEIGIDSSMVEFIDLRFDKPVIRIAPKKS